MILVNVEVDCSGIGRLQVLCWVYFDHCAIGGREMTVFECQQGDNRWNYLHIVFALSADGNIVNDGQ